MAIPFQFYQIWKTTLKRNPILASRDEQVCDSDMSRHGFAGVCRQLELEASGDVPGGFAGFRGPVAYLAGIGFRCVLDL